MKSEKYLRREERQEKNEFYTRFCYSKYRSMKQYSEQQKREKNLIIFLSLKNLILSNNHKLYGHSSLSLRFWYKGFVEDKAKTKSKHQVERKQPKVIELDATVQPKEEIAHE